MSVGSASNKAQRNTDVYIKKCAEWSAMKTGGNDGTQLNVKEHIYNIILLT